MNKKQLNLLACAALFCACQSAQKQTTITGTLTGVESDTLIVSHCPLTDLNHRTMQKDTILLQQGKFTLSLANDSTPTVAYLQPLASGELATSIATVVAFPGETVQVNGSADPYDYTLTGNKFHAAWQTVKDQYHPYMIQLDSIANVLTTKQKAGVAQDSIYYIYQNVYSPVLEKMQEVKRDYIRQHPDDDLSVYLIIELQNDAKELLPLIGEKAKSGVMAPVYQAMYNAQQEKEAREEARKNMVEGVVAPDFTLKDLQGKDLTLSSLRGKYVVLDFWGSWCGWCIKGIPDMKKYYEKYKDRMEILGVDCRDTEEKWRATVEKYELPWLHVYNTDEADITVKYGIQGYPTKIVIDPEGKVAKIVIGEDPAFYEYLDELFK